MLALKPPAGSAYAGRSDVVASSLSSSDGVHEFFGSSTPPPGLSAAPDAAVDEDCSPTSTHYRRFIDMRRNHSADW